MREKRGPWFLFTGLVIGLAGGILYSWLVAPVQFMDTDPASLHPDFRAEYRALIALAYLSDGDAGRALVRLELLRDQDPTAVLESQAKQAQKNKRPEREIQALAALAAELSQRPPLVLASAGTQDEQLSLTPAEGEVPLELASTPTPQQDQMILTPTPTPLATFTPRPTATFRAVLQAPFVLSDRQAVCDPDLPEGLLQIEALDSAGKPVAGVRAVATWAGGENAFYTGLNPRISPGYADFVMGPGQVYSLKVGEGGETITDLTPQKCQSGAAPGGGEDPSDSSYWGGWRLRFTQR